jgi:hypothetical protein
MLLLGFVYSQTSTRLWRKNRHTAPSGSSCLGVDINRSDRSVFSLYNNLTPSIEIGHILHGARALELPLLLALKITRVQAQPQNPRRRLGNRSLPAVNLSEVVLLDMYAPFYAHYPSYLPLYSLIGTVRNAYNPLG